MAEISDSAVDTAPNETTNDIADAVTQEDSPIESAAEQSPADQASPEWILANGTQQQIAELSTRMGEGEEPAGEESEEATGEVTEEETTEEAEEPVEQSSALPKRIQLKSFSLADRARLVAAQDLVREKPGMSLLAALREVGADFSTVDTVPEEVTQAPATPTADPLSEKAEKLEALQAELDAAREGFDSPLQAKLSRQINGLLIEIAQDRFEASAPKKQQAEAQRVVMDKAVAAVSAAMPDIDKVGTPLQKAADSIVSMMKPEFFQNPEWPKDMARMAWAKAHPDKPIPTLGAKAPASKVVTPPRKPGFSPAALNTGNGVNTNTLIARALSPSGTQADIEAAANASNRR
jgi:hypothetical protein